MITWSIGQALAAPGIATTVVSTDDPAIAAVALAAGAEVPFLRPAELATDASPTEPTMLHALKVMEARDGRYDAVMLLQPTSPLRLAGTIDRALAEFDETAADSLVGVVASHAFFWQREPQVAACYDFGNRPRRQDILPEDRRYRETGSVYITARDAFVASGNRLCGKIALFEMAEEEGFEIDTLTDFAVIDTLFKQSQTC